MKNILGALALAAFGTVSLAASANAMPAVSSIAGVGEQTTASVEQVGYYKRHHYGHGKWYGGHRYWGHKYYGYGHGRHYGYGYGYGHSWKKFCYYNPYHWKCKHYDY
jgi:hypothetical protein